MNKSFLACYNNEEIYSYILNLITNNLHIFKLHIVQIKNLITKLIPDVICMLNILPII